MVYLIVSCSYDVPGGARPPGTVSLKQVFVFHRDGYTLAMLSPANKGPKSPGAPSPKKGQKKEEDWKEVIRK